MFLKISLAYSATANSSVVSVSISLYSGFSTSGCVYITVGKLFLTKIFLSRTYSMTSSYETELAEMAK